MTFGSLFAGVGGFDLGLERAGFTCRWQVEIDERARDVLAVHWPDVVRHADVTQVGAELEPVDVICGGFPCQDLSVAGRRAGLAGARSGLFYEMARVIGGLRPAAVLWENVPGLLSSNSGRDFAAVLVELDRLGYCGAWSTLNARYFGVAQRRRRVFGVFVEHRVGARCAAQVLALAARLPGHPAPRRETRQDVAGALGARTKGAGPRLEDAVNGGLIPRIADPVSAHEHCTYTHEGNTFRLHNVVPAVSSKWAKGTGGPAGDEVQNLVPELAPTLRVGGRADGSGSSYDNTPVTPFEVAHLTHPENRSNPKPGDPAYTLASDGHAPHVAGTLRGNPYNNSDAAAEARMHIPAALGVRRLTPRECERLQGFPDDWTRFGADGKEISDTPRYRMIGNAVAVPVAAWIGRRLAAALVTGGDPTP